MSKSADRIAFSRCPETCPDVDRAFGDARDDLLRMLEDHQHRAAEKTLDWLCEQVKRVGTEKLRGALVGVAEELVEALDRCDSLECEVDSLRSEVAELNIELREATA